MNDNAVAQAYRVVGFAGKPRSTRSGELASKPLDTIRPKRRNHAKQPSVDIFSRHL